MPEFNRVTLDPPKFIQVKGGDGQEAPFDAWINIAQIAFIIQNGSGSTVHLKDMGASSNRINVRESAQAFHQRLLDL